MTAGCATQGSRNFTLLRKIALNLVARDRSTQTSLRGRRKKAARDDGYMLQIIARQAHAGTLGNNYVLLRPFMCSGAHSPPWALVLQAPLRAGFSLRPALPDPGRPPLRWSRVIASPGIPSPRP